MTYTKANTSQTAGSACRTNVILYLGRIASNIKMARLDSLVASIQKGTYPMKNVLLFLVATTIITFLPGSLLSQQDQSTEKPPSSPLVPDASESGPNYHIKGLELSYEDDSPPSALQIKVKYNHREVWQRKVRLADGDLTEIDFRAETDFDEESKPGYSDDQSIYLYLECDQFASQWITLDRDGEILSPKKPGRIKLYKKRFAVVEYAYYEGDNPDFSNREPTQSGVKTLGHWDRLPGFRVDWQIWQGGVNQKKLFGNQLFVQFHRTTKENGLIRLGPNESFDTMAKVPTEGYKTRYGAVLPGHCFYCRVSNGYGKLLIREITLNPPKPESVDTKK